MLLWVYVRTRKVSPRVSIFILTAAASGFAFGTPSCSAAEPLNDAPARTASAIVVDATLVDLGKYLSGTVVEHRFTLVNNGTERYGIRITGKSCVCTEADLEADLVSPGGKTFLDVKINTANTSGKKSATIVLETTETGTPNTTLTLLYFVAEVFSVTPLQVNCGEVSTSTDTIRFVRVGFNNDYEISGIVASCSAAWIKADVVDSPETLLPLAPVFFSDRRINKEIYVRLIVKAPLSRIGDDFAEGIEITSQGRSVFVRNVVVTGYFVDRTRVIPRMVGIVKSANEEVGRADIAIESLTEAQIAEVKILSIPPYLQADIKHREIGMKYDLFLMAGDPTRRGKTSAGIDIQVTYQDSYVENISIPVIVLSL